jgi:hypothetical protein
MYRTMLLKIVRVDSSAVIKFFLSHTVTSVSDPHLSQCGSVSRSNSKGLMIKIENNFQLKKKLYFFQNINLHIPRPPLRTSKLLRVILPSWIRIRIRSPDADPDPSD